MLGSWISGDPLWVRFLCLYEFFHGADDGRKGAAVCLTSCAPCVLLSMVDMLPFLGPHMCAETRGVILVLSGLDCLAREIYELPLAISSVPGLNFRFLLAGSKDSLSSPFPSFSGCNSISNLLLLPPQGYASSQPTAMGPTKD